MSGLDDADRALVRVSAALGAWSLGRAERDDVGWALRMAAEEASPGAVEEVLVQSHLFLGYPAALTALGLWREVSGRPADPPRPWEPGAWEERGEEVCRSVYGGQYERLREAVRGLHGDLERWMVVDGYGKVLGRDGLGLRSRELCVVALLAVTGWPTQLYSHLRGALQVGAAPEDVGEALEAALAVADDRARSEARRCWARVRERTKGL